MAKYNAAAHRIETDDGRTLATLTPLVETAKAWAVADWWGGDNEEIELLEEDLCNEQVSKHEEQGRREFAEAELRKAEDKLSAAWARIEELEAELGARKEKGSDAA